MTELVSGEVGLKKYRGFLSVSLEQNALKIDRLSIPIQFIDLVFLEKSHGVTAIRIYHHELHAPRNIRFVPRDPEAWIAMLRAKGVRSGERPELVPLGYRLFSPAEWVLQIVLKLGYIVIGLALFYFISTQARMLGTDGTRRYHYPNGKVEFEGKFVDGKYDGLLRWFRKDGTPLRDEEYAVGIANGKSRGYYPNGRLEFEGNKKGGQWQGLVTWYREDGAVLREEEYADGVANGRSRGFYPDHRVQFEAFNRNGQWEGRVVWYNPDGSIKETCDYENGVVGKCDKRKVAAW